MKKHEEIYQELVSDKLFDSLKERLFEEEKMEGGEIRSITREEEDGFPYVLSTVDSKKGNSATMLGIFIDIRKWFPDYQGSTYYFPLVCLSQEGNAIFTKNFDFDVSVAHELRYVKGMMALIERDSSYPERVRKYSIRNDLKKPEDWEKSVDVETFKMFILEPPVLLHEYQSGGGKMGIDLPDGSTVYISATEEEFVQTHLGRLLFSLETTFIKKGWKDKKIRKLTEKAINKYGKEIYGEKPFEAFQSVQKKYAGHLMKEMWKKGTIPLKKGVDPKEFQKLLEAEGIF